MPDDQAISSIKQFIAATNFWISIDDGHKQLSDRYLEPSLPGMAATIKSNIDPNSFFRMNKDYHEKKAAAQKSTDFLAPMLVELAKRHGVPGGAFLLPVLRKLALQPSDCLMPW